MSQASLLQMQAQIDNLNQRVDELEAQVNRPAISAYLSAESILEGMQKRESAALLRLNQRIAQAALHKPSHVPAHATGSLSRSAHAGLSAAPVASLPPSRDRFADPVADPTAVPNEVIGL